ncbi:MAG: hypothetical protein RBS37_10145 [Bacteroidales bacterium]|nr:hypothetical protein [Bacteroidales bacterium]
MNQFLPKIIAVIIVAVLSVSMLNAQETDEQALLKQLFSNTSFSGQWFLIYQLRENDGDYFNEFSLRRGYITFNKKFSDNVSVRFTQDITLDEEGSDAGNIEMRLKYCLLHIDNGFLPLLRNSWWEVGLINRPWFGFEDKVNDYRVQGAMYLDKYKVLSSADFGVSFSGLIGGTVNSDYRERVSNFFPGLYGSYSLGIYNGGGYNAIEMNSNKTIEGRLTIRPLGNTLPGLQLSYSFLSGKGNTPDLPHFHFNHLYLSWQSRPLILAGQIYQGKGNGAGSLKDEEGNSYVNHGYSLFGELKILPTKWALMTRIDRYLTENEDGSQCSSVVTGICYRFLENNKILLNTDISNRDGVRTNIYEAAIEIRF